MQYDSLIRLICESPTPPSLDGGQLVFDVERREAQAKIDELKKMGWKNITAIPFAKKTMAKIEPDQYVKHFNVTLHRPWLLAVLQRLEQLDPQALQPGGPLRQTWEAADAANQYPNPLPVPWYSQTDSDTNQAARMCFSSSCAMLVEFMRPGSLPGANGDDHYLKLVQQFGDTTSADAQLQALQRFGVKAEFVKNADFNTVRRQIDLGIPVPVGFLHRGPISAPSGGGHWLIIVGYDATSVIVHDPFGEADLVSGNTIGRRARFMRYSMKNFGRRWMVDSSKGNAYAPGMGWAIIARR